MSKSHIAPPRPPREHRRSRNIVNHRLDPAAGFADLWREEDDHAIDSSTFLAALLLLVVAALPAARWTRRARATPCSTAPCGW